MRVMLTGANGYIGMRLLPILVEAGHTVTCVVRDRNRFQPPGDILIKAEVIEFDFLNPEKSRETFEGKEFDIAFYLIHSLKDTFVSLVELEQRSAECFVDVARHTHVRQLIYLGGISNQNALSAHLKARKTVKDVLMQSGINYTIFEAGIIVGSGSASFEIIRDLVEKMPVLAGPLWLRSNCQPIAIRNVVNYLSMAVGNEKTYRRTFEIGGPDVLTYKQMMLQFSEVRGIRRHVFILPFLSPRLSSYWLYIITSTNFTIARQLVESMKYDVVCKDNSVREILPQELIPYPDAIRLAFQMIKQNMVVSSWKDASTSTLNHLAINEYIEVPVLGCFRDRRWTEIAAEDVEEITARFFGIGGENGWYYADTLWRLRGLIDKLFGGVGLRRGRKNNQALKTGDVLDFWRVILADRENHRLLLFAEMKLPGEACLEFSIVKYHNHYLYKQTATFRPKGIAGRNYWYSMLPFHFFIFRNMLKKITGK